MYDPELLLEMLEQHYPDIQWAGVKGVRDVISHQYFNIDAEEIFNICKNDLQPLCNAVKDMITELKNGNSS